MFEAHLQVQLFYTLLSIFVLCGAVFITYDNKSVWRYSSVIVYALAFFAILFIGWRQWWVQEVYVDSVAYANYYNALSYHSSEDTKDLGFFILQSICHTCGFSVDVFFIICALFYVCLKVATAKTISPKYSFILLLAMMTTIGFHNYGTNVLRAGIATSFMLLAFVKFDKTRQFWLYALLGVLFHKSVALPLAAFICARIYNKNINWYIIIWLLAIPLSIVVKPYVSDFILGIDFLGDRAERYLTGEADASKFSHVGFRYDFVMFSAAPLFVGWYFIVKKKFTDRFYQIIFCTYTLANAAWILINDVPFSDRFAYLSWFMMPIIIFYPFLYCNNVRKRFLKIATILVLQLVFILII